jgi:hypothetical protein
MKQRTGFISPRLLLAAAVGFAVFAALTACAPAVVPKTAPHPGPIKVSSTPTPKPLALPVIRVTKTCSQLVSASALTTAIGVAAAPITSPDAYDSEAFTQDGALTCDWSDNVANDAQLTSNHLVLWVLPDVSTANWTQAATLLASEISAKTTIINGSAYGSCSSFTATSTVCYVDTLVGTTWISVEVESLTKSFNSSDAALTHFAALINPIVAAAGAPGFITEPKWSDPAATTVPADCNSTLPDSEIESVTGATGVESIGADFAGQESIAGFWGVEANLGYIECDLASADQQSGFFLGVLPGGGWAWSLEQTAASSKPGYSTVPSLGSKAVEYVGDNDEVTIVWVRGDNLVTLNVGLPTASLNAGDALTLGTYVNTKIAG